MCLTGLKRRFLIPAIVEDYRKAIMDAPVDHVGNRRSMSWLVPGPGGGPTWRAHKLDAYAWRISLAAFLHPYHKTDPV